ncbi:entericidin A/B family lipoprotein [Sphingomicrobium sediminis]|uniref:Entericidin A/B family lipoprotein n=1 Tax=Sphingomicrobium sediminis TaxID=2950949 RepID=A0A9X2EG85_9SPHN|nr:entericidin A/B family lipoprotein [Sphingomicrobium sediminis]MCM8557433.1 entericidin A/B family lipoprotein [Sphingomicrobium sediminis]
MRKLLTMALVGGALVLSACNTVQGLGEDISSAGECGEDVINGENC